ncbi:MAG: hypothetical protein JWN52_415 [Actinomycetia bacterium]|nr:hypothetical protein [Actinomycetes bacterium]
MGDLSTEPKRLRLEISLAGMEPARDPAFRHPGSHEVVALGALMLDAYRGTPDEEDAGGTPDEATAEIRRVFDGTYGPPLLDASFVADDEGRPVGAALVTLWKEMPLLAFVFTAPASTGKGLGRRLIQATMHALAGQGYERLSLAVTEHNTRARRLYETLGFRPPA